MKQKFSLLRVVVVVFICLLILIGLLITAVLVLSPKPERFDSIYQKIEN